MSFFSSAKLCWSLTLDAASSERWGNHRRHPWKPWNISLGTRNCEKNSMQRGVGINLWSASVKTWVWILSTQVKRQVWLYILALCPAEIGRDKWMLRTNWPAGLAKLASFWFTGRPYLTTVGGEGSRKRVNILRPPFTYPHGCVHPHAHVHRAHTYMYFVGIGWKHLLYINQNSLV